MSAARLSAALLFAALSAPVQAQAPAQALFFGELGSLRKAVSASPEAARLASRSDDLALRLVLERLHGSGVPESWIREAFARPEVKIEPEVVRRWAAPAERPGPRRTYEDYRRIFIQPARIAAGAAFVRNNAVLLADVSRAYGVDPHLLASFPGIETYYGRYAGKHSVFNALYTAVHKVPRRSAWAARELAEFLKYCHADGVDTQSVLGSYAGAFGYGQFVPSSFNHYAVDFDGDGVRRPDEWTDVIASIANYLVENGHRPGDRDFSRGSSVWNAIYAYNHYEYYVRVILDFRAELLRAAPPPPSAGAS